MMTEPTNHPVRSFLGNCFDRAKSAFSKWREIRQLDPQDIDAVARDLNLSAADLVSLMFISPDSLESLNKRLVYEGLSEEALTVSHPDELRDLRRVCSLCNEKGRCARDVRHKRMASSSTYCPNEPTLRLLAREARHEPARQMLGIPGLV